MALYHFAPLRGEEAWMSGDEHWLTPAFGGGQFKKFPISLVELIRVKIRRNRS
jgi:hypothetical protein